MAEIGYDDVRMIATPTAEAKCCRVLGVAVVLLYAAVIAVILGAVTGCISTTIRNDGSGTVNVFVEKRISTDASVPASIIP
jgi:hypothetical protein